MNKKIITGVIVVVVVGGVFYGGMTYGKSATPARGQFANGQFTGNINGARGAGARVGMNGGFTAGEIISKDATSVTIKMQDGSTKIALIASSTQIMKSSTGSLSDLSTGVNVTITGAANSDGSVTAQSMQIRPAGSAPIGGVRTNQ
ncbi:MAG: hypothetical protein WAX44_04585 [Minisyncoccia bacterium]